MHTAEISVSSDALASSLAEMRSWLDEKHSEPASFDYFQGAESLIVRVSFKAAEEARAFALKFGGTVRSPTATGDGGRAVKASSALG